MSSDSSTWMRIENDLYDKINAGLKDYEGLARSRLLGVFQSRALQEAFREKLDAYDERDARSTFLGVLKGRQKKLVQLRRIKAPWG